MDVPLLGRCDRMVFDLCKELGWEDHLRALWAEAELKTERREGGGKTDGQENEEEKERKEDEQVRTEIDALRAALAAESSKIAPPPAEKPPEGRGRPKRNFGPCTPFHLDLGSLLCTSPIRTQPPPLRLF